MNRVGWVAVDERYPSGQHDDISDLLSLAPEAFAAAALPLDMNAARMANLAKRLKMDFGVAVIPVISEEHFEGGSDAVLNSISALATGGVLATDRGYPPTVLMTRFVRFAGGGDLISRLRETLVSAGGGRIGWINSVGTLTATPVGFDFLVDWPPFSGLAADRDRETRELDALDLAIDASRRHANDGSLALSVLVGTGIDGCYELGTRKIAGLDAPIAQLWLDSARRFASNRLGFGIPYAFIRLLGSRKSSPPKWLSGFLRQASQSSWLRPLPAEPVSAPKSDGLQPRIAVVIHLYYPDLWPEFRAAIEAIPEPADVYISTPLRIAEAVRAKVLHDRPNAVVFGTRNIGRDVLPFLHVLRSLGTERYRYVLKLHGKKSAHMDSADNVQVLGGGEAWRRSAIAELAGSPQRISELLGIMDADDRIGLVAPAGHLFDQAQWRCGTGNLVARLHRELNIQREASSFPAGTMFWVRPAAIAPLVSADSDLLDFEREAAQLDGTLHHAIERTFADVTVDAGYRLVDTSITAASRVSP